MVMSCVAECVAINKKTKARVFANIKVGSLVKFSVPIEAVGYNRGRTYAVAIECMNVATGECTTFTFNEIERVLKCFEFEQKI